MIGMVGKGGITLSPKPLARKCSEITPVSRNSGAVGAPVKTSSFRLKEREAELVNSGSFSMKLD